MFGNNPKKEVKKLRKELQDLNRGFEAIANASNLMQKLHYDYDRFREEAKNVVENQENYLKFHENIKLAIHEFCEQNNIQEVSGDSFENLKTLSSILEGGIYNAGMLNESMARVLTISETTIGYFKEIQEKKDAVQVKLDSLDKQLDTLQK